MTRYVALSTTNPAGGWQPLATGGTERDVRAEAEQAIQRDTPGYRDTLLRNLVVLSETRAKRGGYMQRDQFVAVCPEHGAYLAGGRGDDLYCRCPGYHTQEME